jgi:hypothetical protein
MCKRDSVARFVFTSGGERGSDSAGAQQAVRAMNLSQVSDELARVREATCGMEAYHVELLAGLRDKSEVVKFLQGEVQDFRARLALIQQNLQGNVVHMGILNDLSTTHSILCQVRPSPHSHARAAYQTLVTKAPCRQSRA